MSPAAKVRDKLTTRDAVDQLIGLNQAIEDHIDEIELNGGALPDWMAAMLDEVNAAMADRVDAIAAKIDEFAGYAHTAKATADRAARRRKVWENAIAGLKGYALSQVERSGLDRLRGSVATLRIQRNSAPATELAYTDEQLLEILDAEARKILTPRSDPEHPLTRFLTVTRIVTVDRKALAAAVDARRAELEATVAPLRESDLPDEVMARLRGADGAAHPDDIAGELAEMRRRYIADTLAVEFPGVSCSRGFHLRID